MDNITKLTNNIEDTRRRREHYLDNNSPEDDEFYIKKLNSFKIDLKNKKDRLTRLKYVRSNLRIELTDHAVVRYLNRYCSLEPETIYKIIITPFIKKSIFNIKGNGKVAIPGTNTVLIVKNYKIITIY